ncbi:MAG: hypothetical protein ABIV48_09660, partial [Pyrinomonadaceae bacterium]
MLKKIAILNLILFVMTGFMPAQDKQELAAEKAANSKIKGEHPLIALSKSKPSTLKKELIGVHPRVFMTQGKIDGLKQKAKTEKELWQTTLDRVRAMVVEPPLPPAEERRVQNEVGMGIAEAAFVYKIT